MNAVWLLLMSHAVAGEASLHGDVKTFYVASFPTDLPNTAQGIADFRLKFEAEAGSSWSFLAHHAVTTFNVPPGQGLAGTTSGVGLVAPEFIDLTWQPDTGDQLLVRGRTDRLSVKYSRPGLDVTLGRQPVTFGSGLVFTPFDIVNPFNAATIDTEYKPGVDALRVDGYIGTANRITGVAAWAGDPIHTDDTRVNLENTILALNSSATVGVTDLSALVASVRGEPVFGVGMVSSAGPVGLHGDVTLTLPNDVARETEPFVRAVVGADYRPTTTTTLSAEVYYQGFGAIDPDEYFAVFTSPRFARGEVWQVGRYYASLAVAQEVTPLVNVNVAAVTNLTDPSVLLSAGLNWSIANNATLGAGIFAGLGRSPDFASEGIFRSEFGTYPPAGFLSVRTYF